MSDLDDEEIKATRILNGVDKENNNIEKDVERCKQLIRVEHANQIGISNQLAIAHVVDRVKELEEETEELKQALARNIAKNFTSSMKELAKAKQDLEMLNKGWQIELEKKDKIIDLIINAVYKRFKAELLLEYGFENEEQFKQYFERKSEEC